ncbi:hypothetical protein F2Q70_00026839 [Brassica cretica]|uniref:Uncharacterized protein n=1 Tax=Brassica cretica TaxID=69181 RepID=A0A8S9KZY1_BRACR|nr:hypothetical protein F2Q70_00026839 [Brassica cretica]
MGVTDTPFIFFSTNLIFSSHSNCLLACSSLHPSSSPLSQILQFLSYDEKMGNCLPNSTTKTTAEISPATAKPTSAVTVKLSGPPNSLATSYLRFALLHKKVNLRFVPSEDQKPTIHVGAETVSGSQEVLLRYIESRG